LEDESKPSSLQRKGPWSKKKDSHRHGKLGFAGDVHFLRPSLYKAKVWAKTKKKKKAREFFNGRKNFFGWGVTKVLKAQAELWEVRAGSMDKRRSGIWKKKGIRQRSARPIPSEKEQ